MGQLTVSGFELGTNAHLSTRLPLSNNLKLLYRLKYFDFFFNKTKENSLNRSSENL